MIKCYFRANLKIDVTKNRIFWGISWVKLKSEIHSPGNFLLMWLAIHHGAITLAVLLHKKMTEAGT